MATGQDDFDIVGFGGGDSVDSGRDFVKKHGLTFRNVYDEGRQVWGELGVTKQPAWVLYDADGLEIEMGAGAIPVDRIRELI